MRKLGFTLVEIAVVMATAGSLSLIKAEESKLQTSQDKARALGSEIYQYNNAVSRYIAMNSADPSTVVGIHTGSSWLKGISCSGTATEEYLDCNLLANDKTIQYQIYPTTEITVNGSGTLEAMTVWSPVSGNAGGVDTLVMGIAALVASGSYMSENIDGAASLSGPTIFCPDIVALSPTISPICGTTRNRIVSIVGANSALEAWLRTDHGNTMKHVMEFDDGSGAPTDEATLGAVDNSNWRQIVNVSRLYNRGASGDDSLIIGQSTGNLIYTDSLLVAKSLLEGAVVIDGDLGVVENLFVKGSIMAGDYQASGGTEPVDPGDIVAEKDLISGEDVVAADDVIVGNRLRVNQYLEFVTRHSVGALCPTNGVVSLATNGRMVSCLGGQWTYVGGETPGLYGYFNANSCPTGWTLADGTSGTLDMRGEFIRTWDRGRGIDSGRALGSFQGESFKQHTHTGNTDGAGAHDHGGRTYGGGNHRHALQGYSMSSSNRRSRYSSESSWGPWRGGSYASWSNYSGNHDHGIRRQGNHTHNITMNTTGGAETRPRNKALLLCMKL